MAKSHFDTKGLDLDPLPLSAKFLLYFSFDGYSKENVFDYKCSNFPLIYSIFNFFLMTLFRLENNARITCSHDMLQVQTS